MPDNKPTPWNVHGVSQDIRDRLFIQKRKRGIKSMGKLLEYALKLLEGEK